ncbi:MAG: chloride channel protein [Spirochaetaceae bacterium]|nr:chloride channel protein [Spirochaetaceae bacterium]
MRLKLPVFAAIIGAVASIVFWLFLYLIKLGTELVWSVIPDFFSDISFYPLIICTIGGLIIGVFRRLFGDYPEDMMTVFGKLKKNRSYPYRNLPVLLIAALLPLIFGSSVGPEAGMVGVIVALCCWAGDKIKFAGNTSEYYSMIGAEVTLSVMFRSPLFGLLDVNEGTGEAGVTDQKKDLEGSTRIIMYGMATGAGFGMFWLMNNLFGKVTEGFPSFEMVPADKVDYLLFIIYLICGIILGLFYEVSEKILVKTGNKLPPVVKETVAGIILGGVACMLPVIRFSGEEQMGILIRDYSKYAPLAMIGIAFLKIIMTNMCICFGLKGGHFFPLIFAAVCLGFGLSLLIFPQDISHATYAAAIVAAGTLGVSMRKPLAVSMLLLICFPAGYLLWILPSAALSAWSGKILN